MEKIFTLRDLEKEQFAKFSLAVIGKPIAHSLSPLMQNAALKYLSKKFPEFSDWRYYKFEVETSDLQNALKAFHSANFVGLNLTIPHKEIVLDFLDEADEFSKLAGAANTLIKTQSGWKGTNTDGFGLEAALYDFCKKDFKNADIVIFGAGGAARAASFYACKNGCASLQISNRTKEKSRRIIEELNGLGFSFVKELTEIKPGSIIINATSLGLKISDAPICDFSKVPQDCVFFDMPYIHKSETVSVLSARANGLAAVSGLGMLAWQGAKSLSVWTKKDMLGEIMLEALRQS